MLINRRSGDYNMRISKLFMPTQREIPSDAEIVSHQLMLRAGLMKKIASGIYSFLPVGYRAYRKVENIVREEMDRAGAQELIMPAILIRRLATLISMKSCGRRRNRLIFSVLVSCMPVSTVSIFS